MRCWKALARSGLSAVVEMRYPGIGIQAVSLTFGTLFVMLFLYRTGMIKVTEKLRLGIIAATGGIAAFYLIEIIVAVSSAAASTLRPINGSGALGIGFSVVVVAVAALNLVLDFDFIEQGVSLGAPKYMEWYGAFGIMVTLICLYPGDSPACSPRCAAGIRNLPQRQPTRCRTGESK